MLTRRNLLTGAASLLATPALSLNRRLRTARVVTAFDGTGSTSTNGTRTPNLNAFAKVMEKGIPEILLNSGFDRMDFQIFSYSAENTFSLVPSTILISNACQSECNRIADVLYNEAKSNVTGNTDLVSALEYGLQLCDMPDMDRRVLNLVTDDDTNRFRPELKLRNLRQSAMDRKITINGFVMGDPMAMEGYIERDIQTPDGITTRTVDYETTYDAWYKKFVLDLA
jgi:hypothetical protein